MTRILLAAAAGLLQGVVEWLPVSSKTMITFVFTAGGYSPGTAYVMGLLANFGSFLAALVYFRKDIIDGLGGLRQPFGPSEGSAKLRYLFIATLFTGIVGVPIYVLVVSALSKAPGTIVMVGIGVLLLVTSAVNRRREHLAAAAGVPATASGPHASAAGGGAADPVPASEVANQSADTTVGLGTVPGAVTSVVVGACQGFAALPGISRSAATVTPLLLRGHAPADAIRFSFLLDVVGLLGAGVVPLVVGHRGFAAISQVGATPVIVMLAVSAVVSFLAIGTILRFASKLKGSVVTLVIGLLAIAMAPLGFGLH
ncbi:MAG: undecaprenyl-diphosphate phosphatase [Acidimicrobiales bacterium]